jgi:hypothetical protein
MKKALTFNPYINHNSSLEEIETELAWLLDYAEKELDWEISASEERQLMALTKLAKAKGSKRKW